MNEPAIYNARIFKGSTWTRTVRWESKTQWMQIPITNITQAAPPVITAANHGIPHLWRVAVTDVKGMYQINAEHNPPFESDFVQANLIDANNVSLIGRSSLSYKPYLSGGSIWYHTPVDLAGLTARMTIKDQIGGTELIALTSPGDITLDNTLKTITITIAAAVTAAFTWYRGVYDLELVNGLVVDKLLRGTVQVFDEVTT